MNRLEPQLRPPPQAHLSAPVSWDSSGLRRRRTCRLRPKLRPNNSVGSGPRPGRSRWPSANLRPASRPRAPDPAYAPGAVAAFLAPAHGGREGRSPGATAVHGGGLWMPPVATCIDGGPCPAVAGAVASLAPSFPWAQESSDYPIGQAGSGGPFGRRPAPALRPPPSPSPPAPSNLTPPAGPNLTPPAGPNLTPPAGPAPRGIPGSGPDPRCRPTRCPRSARPGR